MTEAVAPDGFEEITPFGRHLAVRRIYGPDEYHGNVRLGRFSCSDLQRLSSLMKAKAPVPHRDSIVFLDTETRSMIAGGDPKELLAHSQIPTVRRFLTRGEEERV